MPKLKVDVVRRAMLRKKMKRGDLATATGIHPGTLGNAIWKNQNAIDATKVLAICEALELSYEDVIADEQGADADAPDEPPAVSTSMTGALRKAS